MLVNTDDYFWVTKVGSRRFARYSVFLGLKNGNDVCIGKVTSSMNMLCLCFVCLEFTSKQVLDYCGKESSVPHLVAYMHQSS